MADWKDAGRPVGSSGKKQKVTAKKRREETTKSISPSSESPSSCSVGAEVAFYEEFSDEEVRFLQAYAESCSVEKAALSAGLGLRAVRKFIEKSSVMKEMKMMQMSFRAQWRLSAAQAAGRHVQLMDKAEALLDGGDVKALASLAKMSETSLKATGHFDQAEQGAATNVTVSINIGSVGSGSEVNVDLGSLTSPTTPQLPDPIDITPSPVNEEEGDAS